MIETSLLHGVLEAGTYMAMFTTFLYNGCFISLVLADVVYPDVGLRDEENGR